MNEPVVEEDVYSMNAKITSQGAVVRTLKKGGGSPDEIAAEVAKLIALREQLAVMEAKNAPVDIFNRSGFDQLILRKMYIVPSFEIHNGPAGLFDLGPPACSLKANMLALWRKHFVVSENMLEMECTNLTPENVLQTSGHVERFTDFMSRDEVTGECFRADKLLEDGIDDFLTANPHIPLVEREAHLVIQRQADAFTAEELFAQLQKYNIRSPTNKDNALTMPFPFNLMFKTTIGPDGRSVGFLRPETAQGLFVNFRRLLEYNQAKVPFSAAQVGLGFRNEISPRGGLLRVREFCMAEIEHFVNPDDKTHSKFHTLATKVLVLFPADAQLSTGRTLEISIGEAVAQGLVNNETLGYFMTRTQLWLEKIGVDPKRMRFRQHLKTEMAHYATDCWDMEIHMSSGWTECVGHADRACYDLECHGNKTGTAMTASVLLAEPRNVESLVAVPQKKKIGPKFGKDAKTITKAIESLDIQGIEELKSKIDSDSVANVAGFEITTEHVTFAIEKKTISELKYTPSVIEPSFGIGRVLYAVLEHAFSQRNGDENRCVMSFKPCVAPFKVGIFRLTNNAQLDILTADIQNRAQQAHLVYKVDSTSSTVGRRYARADELGIPFGITVDFDSLLDSCVTLRERDTMAQVRIPISSVIDVVSTLCMEVISWDQIMSAYPVVKEAGDDDEEGDKEKKSTNANTTATKALIVQKTHRGMFSRPNPANA